LESGREDTVLATEPYWAGLRGRRLGRLLSKKIVSASGGLVVRERGHTIEVGLCGHVERTDEVEVKEGGRGGRVGGLGLLAVWLGRMECRMFAHFRVFLGTASASLSGPPGVQPWPCSMSSY